MIRFSCPTCDRPYDLPDALAHLPLICKGCGQRLNVPDPGPDEPPPSEAAVEPDAGVEAKAGDAAGEGMIDFGVHKPDERRIVLSDAERGSLDQNPAAAPAPGGKRTLGLVVDVAVGLALAGVGMLLGEFAVRRSTGAVFAEAGSAAKFPPVDLLVWVGCVATPLLAYALLANRGKTVGGWLRRRG